MDFSGLLGEPLMLLENGYQQVNPAYIVNSAVFLFTLIFLGNVILKTFFNKRR